MRIIEFGPAFGGQVTLTFFPSALTMKVIPGWMVGGILIKKVLLEIIPLVPLAASFPCFELGVDGTSLESTEEVPESIDVRPGEVCIGVSIVGSLSSVVINGLLLMGRSISML